MRLFQLSAACLLFLFLASLSAETTDKPSVRVAQVSGGIVVEASDKEGLDSLDINCPQAESNYHTQLSRLAADKQFKRKFTVTELFPSLGEQKTAVQLQITVRNTRGAVASATIIIPPTHTHKGS